MADGLVERLTLCRAAAGEKRENDDADYGPDGQGAARAHRRRHDGLQEGARRDRRRPREGGRRAAQEGAGGGRQEGRPRRGRRARRAPTSTPAARSACWSRSTARPTSSPAPTSSRSWSSDVAMHIAAAEPRFVRREEVTADVLEREQRDLPRPGARRPGKPAGGDREDRRGQDREVLRRGRACSSSRSSRTPTRRSASWCSEKVAKIGENIQVRRFVRFELGEGIEKRERRLRRRGRRRDVRAERGSMADAPARRRTAASCSSSPARP